MPKVTKADATALSAGDVTYEPDADGVFDVPHDLADWLVRVHDWIHHVPAEPTETKPKAKRATK